MKEVIAIIRMNKVNATKKALADIGVCGLHAIKVMGRGKMAVDFAILDQMGVREEMGSILEDSLSQGMRLIPKRMFTILVTDDQVREVVDTIIRVNQEGNRGDGKIFIAPVTDVVRIRTGERGESVI